MVNLFGLPYQTGGDNSQLGLPLVENEPLKPFVNVKRATVAQTYNLIVADIVAAKTYMEKSGATQKAISLRASGDMANNVYVSMWSGIAITDVDIFTVAKTNDDKTH